MRILDFSDGFSSESVPSQGAVTQNAILTFVDDAAYVTAKGSAAASGDLYFNTTSNVQRHYDGAAWVNSDTILNSLMSAKAADYTVLDTDKIRTVLMTSGGVDRTVTLPAVANNVNRTISVSKVDTGAGDCIVSGTGPELPYTMSLVSEAVTLQCDGANWHIIDTKIPSVGAYYDDTATTSLVSGTPLWMDLTNKVYDTSNNGTDLVTPGVGTWKFTAPKTGKYMVYASYALSSGTQAVGMSSEIAIVKAVTPQQNIAGVHNQSATSTVVNVQGGTTISLNKDDEIHTEMTQNNGANRALLGQSRFQWVQISMIK